jgi:phenylalanine ammonia-lyase
VGQYGSLGASGDLAQNGRILSALLLNPHVRGWTADGKVISLGSFLKRSPLRKLDLHPKAGLSFVNGDNFSTAAATLLSIEVAYLFFLTLLISSLMVQVLKGTNQSFHPYLSTVRPFYGQAEVATILKDLLVGSSLSYDELEKTVRRPEGVKIQDKYSLRCLPQYLGPALETILSCLQRCEIGINSVSDNPILIPSEDLDESKPWQWLSGGNFLGNYAAESIDGLRKVLTQIVKLCDRHLAMLVSQKDNNGLPANLSSSESLAGCVFKGYQNQMGMFEVYASVLSIPVTTFFGVHEEGNQDVTAHGLTSWILAKQLLSITKYALATNLIASIQAVDLLGGVQSLSPKTRFLYEFIRNQVPFISVEQPMSEYLETVNSSLNYSFYLRFVKEVTS